MDLSVDEHNPLNKFCSKLIVNGQTIAYYRIGHGSQVVFICPGLFVPVYGNFVAFLTKMGEEHGDKYTFLTWDRPGYFGSKHPRRNIDDIGLEYDVELSEAFLKALNISKLAVMGFSIGGQQAILYTIRNPKLVSRLLIFGAVDLMNEEELKHHDKITGPKYQIGPGMSYMFNDFGEDKLECKRHIQAWHDYTRRTFTGKNPSDWKKRYETIKCPTLVMYGDSDRIASSRWAQEMHKSIEGSRIEVLKGGTHDMHALPPTAEPFFNLAHEFLSHQS